MHRFDILCVAYVYFVSDLAHFKQIEESFSVVGVFGLVTWCCQKSFARFLFFSGAESFWYSVPKRDQYIRVQ